MSTTSTPNIVRCNFCQEIGHPIALCRKRNTCNYCKKSGHIILECQAKGKRHYSRGNHIQTSYATQASENSSSLDATPTFASASGINISQLVQAELAKALPQALHSAFANLGMTGNSSSRPWFIDFAAFNHMSRNFSLFNTYNPVTHRSVQVANGDRLAIAGIGTIKTPHITLPGTLHVPNLVSNLVSIGQLITSGCDVFFGSSNCRIQDRRTKQTLEWGVNMVATITWTL
ncbi:hypothetical protein LINPERPRIM_LOCUS36860 [Linum perenne]